MSERGFTAFISYRHQSPDMDVAQRLHTAIETYRIPAGIRKKTGRKKMGLVFRDQEELPLSSDLGKDIETALDAAQAALIDAEAELDMYRDGFAEPPVIDPKHIDEI